MTTTKKRNLFEELKQGIREIKDHKAGKITLNKSKLKMLRDEANVKKNHAKHEAK
jgi:hypothetical protein